MDTMPTPILLMVSGGSDSMALLEQAVLRADPSQVLKVLHVNHLLRGAQSDGDEAFVTRRCEELEVECEVKRIDVGAIAAQSSDGMEAVAREQRYSAANQVLDTWCARLGVNPETGQIHVAHTLDDRIETYLMRTLVGTGPGGLGSILPERGRIRRPLLGCLREELRDWLRSQHPGLPDGQIWRDDPTNDDGSNFRSRVRTQLVPVMRQLRPGFERSLERTMDLIAQEDASATSQAQGIVYRNLKWDGNVATLPLGALEGIDRPLARRVLRSCILVVSPDARLESQGIEAILEDCKRPGFAQDQPGGIRVVGDGEALSFFVL